ncbi:MAG: peptidoglycan DD-metalloendopeptidase family protein [Nitriliruptorales bacterium]|nr:peptidoglycan DD-metalloendopeptidase family protein [Nitriliruptorales bacterium]
MSTTRWRRLLLAIVFVLALPSSAVVAQERSSDDIESELEENQRHEEEAHLTLEQLKAQAGSARAALSLLEAQLVATRNELRVLEGQVAIAEAILAEAQLAVDAADAEVVAAEQQLAETAAELQAARELLTQQIVTTYKFGAVAPGIMAVRVMENAGSPEEVLQGMHSLGSVIDYQDRIVERVAELETQHAADLAVTEAAKALAAEQRDIAASALAAVDARRAEAARVEHDLFHQRANQQALLAELESQAANTAAILAELEEERQELEAELAASRGAGANGLLCPVTPSWFQNDWGFPRSGGRTHKGTDVFAERGTPIVAMTSGTVKQVDHVDSYRPGSNSGDLGGIWVSYWVGSGDYWYWSHLEAVASGIAPGVSLRPGDVIGWVGTSGNAYSTPPHVHVGHYVNGSAVNPYPDLSAACHG